jgi:hypothetical protein
MDTTINNNKNKSPSTTIPFQVNLTSSNDSSPSLSDHENRPIINELDFFSQNNNHENLASSSTSAPPYHHIHDHYTNPSSLLELKVNVSSHNLNLFYYYVNRL